LVLEVSIFTCTFVVSIKKENIMTDKEREEFLIYLKDLKKKVAGNKELSLYFLTKAGICTEDGKLTEPYQHLYIPQD